MVRIAAVTHVCRRCLLWLRRLVSVLLWVAGPPRHVAFIMDGNRRFAKRCHQDKIQGHTKGYYKMVDVIKWCLEIGVECISVYAFSIENFKRSPEEVGTLMHLAETKFEELMKEDGLAEREGVEVRVLGDLTLAPPSVQAAAARIMTRTEALPHKRAVLNICFSYTGTEELQQSVRAIRGAVCDGQLTASDVSWPLLQRCLHTRDCPPVDLMIRTSGETRLSDFLLWQTSYALLAFTPCLWPDLSFLEFARCVLKWQRHRGMLSMLQGTAGERTQLQQGEACGLGGTSESGKQGSLQHSVEEPSHDCLGCRAGTGSLEAFGIVRSSSQYHKQRDILQSGELLQSGDVIQSGEALQSREVIPRGEVLRSREVIQRGEAVQSGGNNLAWGKTGDLCSGCLEASRMEGSWNALSDWSEHGTWGVEGGEKGLSGCGPCTTGLTADTQIRPAGEHGDACTDVKGGTGAGVWGGSAGCFGVCDCANRTIGSTLKQRSMGHPSIDSFHLTVAAGGEREGDIPYAVGDDTGNHMIPSMEVKSVPSAGPAQREVEGVHNHTQDEGDIQSSLVTSSSPVRRCTRKKSDVQASISGQMQTVRQVGGCHMSNNNNNTQNMNHNVEDDARVVAACSVGMTPVRLQSLCRSAHCHMCRVLQGVDHAVRLVLSVALHLALVCFQAVGIALGHMRGWTNRKPSPISWHKLHPVRAMRCMKCAVQSLRQESDVPVCESDSTVKGYSEDCSGASCGPASGDAGSHCKGVEGSADAHCTGGLSKGMNGEDGRVSRVAAFLRRRREERLQWMETAMKSAVET